MSVHDCGKPGVLLMPMDNKPPSRKKNVCRLSAAHGRRDRYKRAAKIMSYDYYIDIVITESKASTMKYLNISIIWIMASRKR